MQLRCKSPLQCSAAWLAPGVRLCRRAAELRPQCAYLSADISALELI